MTTDLALLALKGWIESRTGTYPVLDGIPIFLRDTSLERPGDDDDDEVADFDATHIILADTSSEEHPVLRGVLAIQVAAVLHTVASADLGKTDAEHREINAALHNVLADTAAIAYCDGYSGLKCFDIRGTAPTSENTDGMRASTYELQMVCCPG